MELEFIGVGAASDACLGNTSYLFKSDTHLMIDCGYAAPRNLFEKKYQANFIDALYITHFHADHVFGIPALLVRWMEEKRSKCLTIMGQFGTKERVLQLIQLGYPNLLKSLPFELVFIEEENFLQFNELMLYFAETHHSLRNFAIRIDTPHCFLGISGDGALIDKTRDLFQKCQVLVLEAFSFDSSIEGHTNAEQGLAFAKTLPVLKTLAFIHIRREDRLLRKKAFEEMQKGLSFDLIIPEPGETMQIYFEN